MTDQIEVCRGASEGEVVNNTVAHWSLVRLQDSKRRAAFASTRQKPHCSGCLLGRVNDDFDLSSGEPVCCHRKPTKSDVTGLVVSAFHEFLVIQERAIEFFP